MAVTKAGSAIADAYVAMEKMIQTGYDKIPDKVQILTHVPGMVAGTAAGIVAMSKTGELAKDLITEIPKKWSEEVARGNYSTAVIESGGRAMGAVVAGGFTVVLAGVTAANLHATIRSLADKPVLGA